jgi:hypothetical protein
MKSTSGAVRHAFASALILALGSSPALAAKFYTFHPSIDHLVEIDTATGVATALGFIGGPVTAAGGGGLEMEFVAGTLFWTGSPGEGVLALDRGTATPLDYGGRVPYDTGGAAEARQLGGMAWNGSTLVVSYGSCCGSIHRVGDLSSDGTVTNIADYTAFGVRLNLLAISAAGEMYALEDRRSDPVPTGRLHRVHRPGGIDLVGEVLHNPADPFEVRYAGMDFTDTGELWVLERTRLRTYILRRIDPATAQVIEDVPITYTSPYSIALVGLAHVPDVPVHSERRTWGRLKDLYRSGN